MMDMFPGGGDPEMMPDLSHLSEEERAIIEQVLQRQKAEEQKEEEIAQRAEKELEEIERQINERKENAMRLVGTQDDAICQICQKTKFADGIGHKCYKCQLRSCARCGGKTTSKNKNIWACSLCQKRQQILARTGKWFQNPNNENDMANHSESPTPSHSDSIKYPLGEGEYQTISIDNQQQQQQNVVLMETRPIASNQQIRRGSSFETTNLLHQQQQKQQQLQKQQSFHRQTSIQNNSQKMNNNFENEQRRNSVQLTTTTTKIAPILNDDKGTTPTTTTMIQQKNSNRIQRYENEESMELIKQHEQKNNQKQQQKIIYSQNQQSQLIKQRSINNSTQQQQQQQQQPQQNTRQNVAPTTSIVTTTTNYSNGSVALQQQQQQQNPLTRSTRRTSTSTNNNDERYDSQFNEDNLASTSRQTNVLMNKSDRGEMRKIRNERQQLRQPLTTTTTTNNRQTTNISNNLSSVAHVPSATKQQQQQQSLLASNLPVQTTTTITNKQNNSTPLSSSSKTRRSKISRQLRSLSSSDDDEDSRRFQQQQQQQQTNILPQHDSTTPPSIAAQPTDPDFSEKDLLQYIYGTHGFQQNGKNVKKNSMEKFFNATEIAKTISSQQLQQQQQQQKTTTNTRISAGKMLLANKIRDYLSHPVSWQPSADQRRLIGHMILHKSTTMDLTNPTDFGLKVIGGQHSGTGRLGTFVTKVKPGSVADKIGQLRPGDEVLEWNGHSLQNLQHSTVYNLINASRNDNKLELIVSRNAHFPDYDDFLNVRQIVQQNNNNNAFYDPPSNLYDSRTLIDPNPGYGGYSSINNFYGEMYSNSPINQAYSNSIPHSQSLVAPNFTKIGSEFGRQFRAASPLIFHRPLISNNYADSNGPLSTNIPTNSVPNAHICGRIEMSLLYHSHKRELTVTLHRAYDLIPRNDGQPRNPFVKLFLLPDRSEKSRRQSGAIAETLTPVWNECFYYYELTEPMLNSRVLEVTVWDYDKYETNAFLGEILIDLSQTLMDNQPFSYLLLDMDDENPIRLRLKQRRYSSTSQQNTPPFRSRSQTSHYNSTFNKSNNQRQEDYFDCSYSLQNLPFYQHDGTVRCARTHRPGFYGNPIANNDGLIHGAQEFTATGRDWNKNSAPGIPSGYFSDNGGGASGLISTPMSVVHQARTNNRNSRKSRRPKSATALRNVVELEDNNSSYYNEERDSRIDPSSSYLPYEIDQIDLNNRIVERGMPLENLCTSGGSGGGGPRRREYVGRIPQAATARSRGRTRHEILQEQANTAGYGSDGSETLSVNSAQSMQNRTLRAQQQQQQQLNSEIMDSEGGGGSGGLLRNSQNQQQNCGGDFEYSSFEDTNQMQNGSNMSDGGGGGGGTGNNSGRNQNDSPNNNNNNNGNQNNPPIMMQSKGAAMLLAKRKKSIMTRFIPGRNGPSDINKRMGFARSEEVGVSQALAPIPLSTNTGGNNSSTGCGGGGGSGSGGGASSSVNQSITTTNDNNNPTTMSNLTRNNNNVFTKQASKESTDSSENWLPVVSDKPLGTFVENLGPGQVVGRQALASPLMGEIQIGISLDQNQVIIVDVLRAKNLVVKPGAKINPAPYVKAYLMDGKNCVAKAKTQPVRRTTAPLIQQRMAFNESSKHKMLQLSVLGDYGRMERKSFMGIAQINLDDLVDLNSGQQILGWYKLFHSNSLAGSSAQQQTTSNNGSANGVLLQGDPPIRKDSELSLCEIRQ